MRLIVPAPKLLLTRRPDGWWIVGFTDGTPDCGPYQTKAGTNDDRLGLLRFYRHGHKRKFVSVVK